MRMDVYVYTCNPGTWVAETGRSQIQGLHSKFLSDKVKNCDRTIGAAFDDANHCSHTL